MVLHLQPIEETQGGGSDGAQRQSESFCVLPIVGCLMAAEAELGLNPAWTATNYYQRKVLEVLAAFQDKRELMAKLPELRSICSRSYEGIKEFLHNEGFRIQLDPFGGPDDFGMASVLKLVFEWQAKGEVTEIRGRFPAVKLKSAGSRRNSGRTNLSFHRSPDAKNPIAVATTKEGDYVCMMQADLPPTDFQLLDWLRQIDETEKETEEFGAVVFPMVTYDQEIDISWVKGLCCNTDRIVQAKQQTAFGMNQFGGFVKSAAAMAVSRSIAAPKPDLVIDGPFLVWIYRPEIPTPIFTGWFTPETWKDPGTPPT